MASICESFLIQKVWTKGPFTLIDVYVFYILKYTCTDYIKWVVQCHVGLLVWSGLTSLLNILGHVATQCYFDQCAATQECHAADTGHETHPVTVYRHGADLSLCYPLMWNVTLEYTPVAIHFNVFGKTRPGNPSSTFHTQ